MTESSAVLHVARNPRTGVWSVMRNLARWQLAHNKTVGFGLLLPNDWPEEYYRQLSDLVNDGLTAYICHSPNIPGTLSMLFHQLTHPVDRWVNEFSIKGRANSVIVHFHNAWLAGAFLPLPAHAVPVATYHGIAAERVLRVQPIRRRIHAYWAQRFVRLGGRLASVDASNTRTAEDLFGVPSYLFSVIPNGTPPAPKGYCGGPRLVDPSAPLTVGHVGVIDDGKGWQITSAAIELLREEGHNVRFLIAGHGPQADLARSWCAADPTRGEMVGFVANPQSDIFPRLDVLALPSASEGLPMAVLEALAFGIPVIATAVGGLPQVIISNKNGAIVERTPRAVADALRAILDPSRHTTMAEAAQSTHRMFYSTGAMARAYERLYC